MAKQTVKIKKIYRDTKQGKNGSFKVCNICVAGNDGQDIWLGGFDNKVNQGWNEGDTVEVEVWKNEQGYWQYKTPSLSEIIFNQLGEINAKLNLIVNSMGTRSASGVAKPAGSAQSDFPENVPGGQRTSNSGPGDFNDDDLPF